MPRINEYKAKITNIVEWWSTNGVPTTGYINKENEAAYKKLGNLFSLNSSKIKYVERAIKELKRDEWNTKLFQEMPKIM